MRIRAIIHLDKLVENINSVKKRIGHNRFICVSVKADAYGHGAPEIAKTSIKAGVNCLGIATIDEGVELRKAGITAPIMLLSQSHPEEISGIVQAGLIPFISDTRFASILNEYAKSEKIKLPVHMKIDTGMSRIGCLAEEAVSLARHIADCTALDLAGTATHFAVADSTDKQDIDFTNLQLSRFNEAVGVIRAAGIDPGILHTANSGGIILHPNSWFDMVRPGLLLYGYKTANENEISDFPFEPLIVQPVMELRAAVVLIKKIKKGESVSYGRTWTAPQDTNIAVLSVGYADGLPRLSSNKWQVVINGKKFPLAGRVTMDQCMADLGPQTDVRRWDEAVIFGGPAADAAALAETVGTIPYEITCNINKRVPRIYCLK
jgi:alanine racemase